MFPEVPCYNNSVGRRKSVFAEAYNPEEDEEEEKTVRGRFSIVQKGHYFALCITITGNSSQVRCPAQKLNGSREGDSSVQIT